MINIKIDSRKVENGDTFVAIKGQKVDGHEFIKDAINNGAKRIIVSEDVKFDNVEIVKVADTYEWLIQTLIQNYAQTINEMNLIGITGTNGKTTTSYLTYQILNNLASKTAYIGTIGFYITGEDPIELANTTPDIVDLYELLLSAHEKGCQNVVMEVSSHALDQKRVAGLNFKIGAFTNLTQDHLDYHHTMENYLAAKKLILKQITDTMIINVDDPSSDKWLDSNVNYFLLGKKGRDLKIINDEDLLVGTKIIFNYLGQDYEVTTNLKSEFNVYNYLTALSIVLHLGFALEQILAVTPKVFPPKGRCEQIQVKNGIAVIDYAHTPDAVEKIIDAFTKNKKGRIITLIGCGGDRDPKKRPIMGNIATKKSDYVIFTSDNPRTEDPQKIMDDILSGVTTDNYEVILERTLAIKKALDLIQDNDIVLILGKGHEDYQIIGYEKIHLDDAEEVRKYLKSS